MTKGQAMRSTDVDLIVTATGHKSEPANCCYVGKAHDTL